MAPPIAVLTEKAPKPIPQLSQAVRYNGMVYCSGSLGIDPSTSKFVEGSVQDRTVRREFTPYPYAIRLCAHRVTAPSTQEPVGRPRCGGQQPPERRQG